jgi:hypothetical protein
MLNKKEQQFMYIQPRWRRRNHSRVTALLSNGIPEQQTISFQQKDDERPLTRRVNAIRSKD